MDTKRMEILIFGSIAVIIGVLFMVNYLKANTLNNLNKILDSLCKNEISITTQKANKSKIIYRSKFGGNPAVPVGFEWPRFDIGDCDDETANIPLSFLCQINLEEICVYDKENLLPKKGLLLFFYELDSMYCGFDPEDKGSFRVYYFEDVSQLVEMDIPTDMENEYKVKEYDLSFSAKKSYPSYEEFDCCHSDIEYSWNDYSEMLDQKGYNSEIERHKFLGYANLVQGEMLTNCEITSRGLCMNEKNCKNISEDVKNAATDWILLFQMASIQDTDYELLFGDLGNIYFYIRKQDLKECNFDKVWFILQCG